MTTIRRRWRALLARVAARRAPTQLPAAPPSSRRWVFVPDDERRRRWSQLLARDPAAAVEAFCGGGDPDPAWFVGWLSLPHLTAADVAALAAHAGARHRGPPDSPEEQAWFRLLAILTGVAEGHLDPALRFAAWAAIGRAEPGLALIRLDDPDHGVEWVPDPASGRVGPRIHPGRLPLLLPSRGAAAPLLATATRPLREILIRLLADPALAH